MIFSFSAVVGEPPVKATGKWKIHDARIKLYRSIVYDSGSRGAFPRSLHGFRLTLGNWERAMLQVLF